MRYYVAYGRSLNTRRGIVGWDDDNPEITLRCLGVDPDSAPDVSEGEARLAYLAEKGILIAGEGGVAETHASVIAAQEAKDAEAQAIAAKEAKAAAERAAKEAKEKAEVARLHADAEAAKTAEAADAAAAKTAERNASTEKKATRRRGAQKA
jgi:hypothetical protein